jgi:hypothetical protein
MCSCPPTSLARALNHLIYSKSALLPGSCSNPQGFNSNLEASSDDTVISLDALTVNFTC